MLRVQCLHEPMPPWKRTTSAPWPLVRTAMGGADAEATAGLGEPRAHAFGEGRHLPVELAAVEGEELQHEMLDAAGAQLGDLLDEAGWLAGEHAATVGRDGARFSR